MTKASDKVLVKPGSDETCDIQSGAFPFSFRRIIAISIIMYGQDLQAETATVMAAAQQVKRSHYTSLGFT